MKEQERFEYETPGLDGFQYHDVVIVHGADNSRMPDNFDWENDDEL